MCSTEGRSCPAVQLQNIKECGELREPRLGPGEPNPHIPLDPFDPSRPLDPWCLFRPLDPFGHGELLIMAEARPRQTMLLLLLLLHRLLLHRLLLRRLLLHRLLLPLMRGGGQRFAWCIPGGTAHATDGSPAGWVKGGTASGGADGGGI